MKRGKAWRILGVGLVLTAFSSVQWGQNPGIEIRMGYEATSLVPGRISERPIFSEESIGRWATVNVVFLELGVSRVFGDWLGVAGGLWLARSYTSPEGQITFTRYFSTVAKVFSRNPEVYPGLWLEATVGNLQKKRFSLGMHLGFSMRKYHATIVVKPGKSLFGAGNGNTSLYYQRGRAYVFNSFFILQWRLSRIREGSSHAFYFLFSPLAFRWWLDYREFVYPPAGTAFMSVFRMGFLFTMVSIRLLLFPHIWNEKSGEDG